MVFIDIRCTLLLNFSSNGNFNGSSNGISITTEWN